MAPSARFFHQTSFPEALVENFFDYCLSLSIWSFAMLLVSGLDVALVGYFDFEKVAYYSVAATLIVFLCGVQNALFNAMIPSTAVMQARGNSAQLGQLVITATRYGSFILLLMGLPLILAAKGLLTTLWVGPKYAVEGTNSASANRSEHRSVDRCTLRDGPNRDRTTTACNDKSSSGRNSNLIASVIGGLFLGAIGVALGTLVGGIVGVLGNFVYNMPRTIGINLRFVDYLRDGLLRPAVCALPVITFGSILGWSHWFSRLSSALGIVATLLVTAYLVWHWGLTGSERAKLSTGRLVPQV